MIRDVTDSSRLPHGKLASLLSVGVGWVPGATPGLAARPVMRIVAAFSSAWLGRCLGLPNSPVHDVGMLTTLTSQELLTVVGAAQSLEDLKRYFEGTPEAPPFTGGRFELLFGGGDREETANMIAADDLVAVQLLSVSVPGVAALNLLEGQLGKEVAMQLRHIPTDVDLGTPEAAAQFVDGSAAQEAYALLKSPYKIGWVTATKLLARKRPRLVPVYDRVVRCAVGTPAGPWLWFQERFAENGGELAAALRELRADAGVSEGVSLPRFECWT